MTFYFRHDPDTFGLALMWSAPLEGATGHLACHRIHLVLFTLVFAVEWGGP